MMRNEKNKCEAIINIVTFNHQHHVMEIVR